MLADSLPSLPTRHVQCLVCGSTADVEATRVAPHAITWPSCHCPDCSGHPEMAITGRQPQYAQAG